MYGKLNQLDRFMGWFLAAVKCSPCPKVSLFDLCVCAYMYLYCQFLYIYIYMYCKDVRFCIMWLSTQVSPWDLFACVCTGASIYASIVVSRVCIYIYTKFYIYTYIYIYTNIHTG